MQHAGTVIGTYVVVFGSVGVYTAWLVRRARRLAASARDEDKTWI